MRFNNLNDWLNWQQNLNPEEIDLGLDRVSAVLGQLNLSGDFFCPVISVAGTNGKGSTVAIIESILHQSAITVGCYTSPHLFSYNERIRINQQAVSDQVLCEAFEVVDQARLQVETGTALTYFEFGTLAALVIFRKFNVEVAVLEVGLGGRLDAVNVINADVAIISSISIDHVDWLGDDIEGIAGEKAGIMRAGKTAILGFLKPQQTLLEHARQLDVSLLQLGEDYLYQGLAGGRWQLKSTRLQLHDLPLPALQGGFQLQNAAAAIMAIEALLPEWVYEGAGSVGQVDSRAATTPSTITSASIAEGLQKIKLCGRFQVISELPRVVVDVAHNEASAIMLRELLNEYPVGGKTLAIVAMLSDKAITEVLEALFPAIDCWFSAGLSIEGSQRRAMQPKNMAQAVRELHADVKLVECETVDEACKKAKLLAADDDRIIIFGSFYTVVQAIDFFNPK
ncbi:MAG TPA: bifunctional folylpolyglutamate synthase/dihydrofolate synthase [Gammaproteobacteria bacterium]|nr:bifunctional folylpolyglutamate synthase/dihydrofolate synthase [Gammaproteobacteria bacterium]